MSDLVADAIVDPGGTKFCIYDHPGHTGLVTCSQIGVLDDDSETGMGNETIVYRCMLGHEFEQVSRRQIVRSTKYGVRWKSERDRLAGRTGDPGDVTLQQITPVIDGF